MFWDDWFSRSTQLNTKWILVAKKSHIFQSKLGLQRQTHQRHSQKHCAHTGNTLWGVRCFRVAIAPFGNTIKRLQKCKFHQVSRQIGPVPQHTWKFHSQDAFISLCVVIWRAALGNFRWKQPSQFLTLMGFMFSPWKVFPTFSPKQKSSSAIALAPLFVVLWPLETFATPQIGCNTLQEWN